MRAVVDWKVWGSQVLAWLAAEAPRRTTVNGLAADCAAALGPPLRGERLQDWLLESSREQWTAIKRTLGTGVDPQFVGKGNGTGPHGPTGPSAKKSSPVPPGLTILEDERRREAAEDRARCPVCKLGSELHEQVAEAKRAGLTQARIIAALARVHGITIAPNAWAHHVNGRHEQ